MFIDKELAQAMAEGRKRFCCVYEGRALLVMPFPDTERHVATHYVPELKRSIICTGPETCRWHYLVDVAKKHVAAWVFRKAFPWDRRDGASLPATVPFRDCDWSARILELTEHCFAAFDSDRPEYATLGVIAREPGKVNNKVHFTWLHGKKLTQFPDKVLSPEELVPAVIRGTYYPTAAVALDKDEDGRNQTPQVENSFPVCDAAAAAAASDTGKRIGRGRSRKGVA